MAENLLKYKTYAGTIEHDLEQALLHGQIAFINDHISYHGETISELKQAFEEAVDDYLADCADLGKDPNLPFKGSLNVRIGEDRHKALAIKSKELNKSINVLICDAIDASQVNAVVTNHIVNSFEVKLETSFEPALEPFELQKKSPASTRAH